MDGFWKVNKCTSYYNFWLPYQRTFSLLRHVTMAERNDFKRFRIVKLKEYLQQRGITCSIKKKNILLRLCMIAKELDLKVF